MTIYKLENYIDEANRTVFVRTDVKTEDKEYFGSFMINTSKGPLPIQFKFENEETLSLEKCFEIFDTSLQTFVQNKIKEEKSRIVTPDEMSDLNKGQSIL
jgi:hypothetical protein